MDEYEALFKDREHAALYRAFRDYTVTHREFHEEEAEEVHRRVGSLETSRAFVRRSVRFAGWLLGIILTITSILVYSGVFR